MEPKPPSSRSPHPLLAVTLVGHAVRVVAAAKPPAEFAAMAPASLALALCAPDSKFCMGLRMFDAVSSTVCPTEFPRLPFSNRLVI
jgi:hypothetical protein